MMRKDVKKHRNIAGALMLLSCMACSSDPTTSVATASTPPMELLQILPQQATLPTGTQLKSLGVGEMIFAQISSNPYLSKDQELIKSLGSYLTGDPAKTDTITEVLFSCYEANREIGIFAYRFKTAHDAASAQLNPTNSNRLFRYQKGKIVVLVWHDGVDDPTRLAFEEHVKKTLDSQPTVTMSP